MHPFSARQFPKFSLHSFGDLTETENKLVKEKLRAIAVELAAGRASSVKMGWRWVAD